MISRFDEIGNVHEIYITKRYPHGKRKRQFLPTNYFDLDISEFEIDINYKYEDIPLQKIELKDIYNIPEIITGKNLNKKLGLYTNMREDDFNNFIYYETNERKIFLKKLTTLFGPKKYIGICGPFGTGKTITLLKFLIESEFNRVLYINLWTIENTSLVEIKKLLKYESIKLFGLNIYNEKIKCGDPSKKIFKEMVQNIEDFNEKKNIFVLLENIIKKMNELETLSYLIIDQYSSKYDENNESLKQLLKNSKSLKNIYIIISSSMNNDDIKKYFSDSLNHKLLFSTNKKTDSLGLNYYYIGCLIRLNSLKEYDDLLKEKSPKFKKFLNNLGNLSLFYYKLNRK